MTGLVGREAVTQSARARPASESFVFSERLAGRRRHRFGRITRPFGDFVEHQSALAGRVNAGAAGQHDRAENWNEDTDSSLFHVACPNIPPGGIQSA